MLITIANLLLDFMDAWVFYREERGGTRSRSKRVQKKRKS